ncbi:MAG: hypothetical protein WCF67_14530 [Chitinophagaceae bacterium]
MKSKEEIYGLISKNQLYEALEELKLFFGDGNDTLNNFINDFINPPDNHNHVRFIGRLKMFIGNFYKPAPVARIVPQAELDFYDALCEFDFKLQTSNFHLIYRNRKIAAFLLHGDSDEHGNDVRWLYNQLLHVEGLLNDKHITIDCSSALGGSFERFIQELFIKFEIDTSVGNRQKQIAALRSELEDRLKEDHFVCIIKGPENILNNEQELHRLYTEFLSFMDVNIVRKQHSNSLIILFIENKLANYDLKEDKYFFWFNENEKDAHPINAVKCEDVRIIDLAPIQAIEEADIIKWIGWSLTSPSVYKKVCCFNDDPKAVLKEGNKPYQVIKNICAQLNIKMNDKWIH